MLPGSRRLIVQCSFICVIFIMDLHVVICSTEMMVAVGTTKICTVLNINDSTTLTLKTTCTVCRTCNRGEYVKKACSIGSNTVCDTCPPGTFTAEENAPVCKHCRRCQVNGYVFKKCSRTSDTLCSCMDGYFRKGNKCVKCSVCKAGQYAKRACSKVTDTKCSRCRPGSFTTTENTYSYCQACDVCSKNHIHKRKCSSTKNAICGRCMPGYYQDQNRAGCEKCSYCYPEHPGYTVQVDECVKIMSDTNWTCMPVTRPPPTVLLYNSDDSNDFVLSKFLEEDIINYSTSTTNVNIDTDHIETRSYVRIIIFSVVFIILIILLICMCVLTIILKRRKKRCFTQKAIGKQDSFYKMEVSDPTGPGNTSNKCVVRDAVKSIPTDTFLSYPTQITYCLPRISSLYKHKPDSVQSNSVWYPQETKCDKSKLHQIQTYLSAQWEPGINQLEHEPFPSDLYRTM